MHPKQIFLFNSVLNMKQTRRRLSFYYSFLALAARWSRAHHSLRIDAQLGSFSQPEWTLLIISAGLLWNANIYTQTEPTAIERPPKGLLKQELRIARIEQADGARIRITSVATLLFAVLTISQVQNNQIPCSPRPERAKADGRRIRADKIGQSFRAADRQKNCQVHHVKAQRREFGPSGVS